MKEEKFFKEYVPSKIGGEKNPLRKVPGCYCVEHKDSGKVYVGSTGSLSDRANKTMSSLRNNKHNNKNLQELYNANSDVTIYVEPAETTNEAQLMEQTVVDHLKRTDFLCNVAVNNVTKTKLGTKLSDEHKRILLDASLGSKRSKEAKRKMSESHKGVALKEEHKQKLSEIHKERLSTPEGKAAHDRGIEKLKHRVCVGGVIYSSKSEAARTLGIDITTIMYRCKSPNFTDTYEIEGD